MGFSNEWEELYDSGQHLSIWPWSDLVSLVHRFTSDLGPQIRVLEIGCGAGANIHFFKKIGVEYFGIDGSPTIVSSLKKEHPELEGQIAACDFTQTLYFEEPFDLIVDRASLTHNNDVGIRQTINLVKESLSENGKFISVDWFSTEHYGFTSGEAGTDPYTRENFAEGSLTGTGVAHFSDRDNLSSIFADWEIIYLLHKTYDEQIPHNQFNPAFWNIIAKVK